MRRTLESAPINANRLLLFSAEGSGASSRRETSKPFNTNYRRVVRRSAATTSARCSNSSGTSIVVCIEQYLQEFGPWRNLQVPFQRFFGNRIITRHQVLQKGRFLHREERQSFRRWPAPFTMASLLFCRFLSVPLRISIGGGGGDAGVAAGVATSLRSVSSDTKWQWALVEASLHFSKGM